MLVDQNGQQKIMLKMSEHKSLQTDRVILIPGPEDEVKVVQWIYSVFLNEHKTESEIAELLNAWGLVTDFGRAWTRGTVRQVHTNEKYIGNNVYHRTSFKLKRKHVVNPSEKWIRASGVFTGIVGSALFIRVRELILARSQKLTNQEMLEKLRGLLKQQGHLRQGIASLDVQPAFALVRVNFHDRHSTPFCILLDCVQLVAGGVLLVLRGHPHISRCND